MEPKKILIKSKSIYDGTDRPPFSGYILIKGEIIHEVSDFEPSTNLMNSCDEVIDFNDGLISPGFIDVHCFFSGYAMNYIGENLLNVTSSEELKIYLDLNKSSDTILGHSLSPNLLNKANEELVNTYITPIVLMINGCEKCLMNQAAKNIYKFTPETCYPESFWRLISINLNNKIKITSLFEKYIQFMNSKGVTGVKEMGFDDYYGFTSILKEFDSKNKLNLRYHFMSQPVAKPLDLSFADKITKELENTSVQFSGFNLMTDESISENKGELKQPYSCEVSPNNLKPINWELIKDLTHQVDESNYRISLHAQGDGAVSKILDIYETCKKDANGQLINRHAITDLELTDPIDLERMGKINAIAEIYPQIQSLYSYTEKTELIYDKIGIERSKNYWNRRKMIDSGITLSCATDLPLLFDDIPSSIYYSCGGHFRLGKEVFNIQNTITRQEILKAWTSGGAYNLSRENDIGTLEVGKKADIAIFNMNLFNIPLIDLNKAYIVTTIFNGKIVYKKKG
ncbi:amidohydrolase family protein [Streptococcus dysgalactiae]|uniref:Amidohydrolase family protein n=1 Tax=Streptococcus dysgalactiae TaxID=1334 RepID=A0AAE9UMF9_STRDY|nr:amidohydrolase family protein [Streptococcus dysgalactiae]WAI93313.1 amidohydrolase family protein [Streptococcus dysgalactiae]